MFDWKFIDQARKYGYVNYRGQSVHGNAALLHILSLMEHTNVRLKDIDPETVERGRTFVQKILSE